MIRGLVAAAANAALLGVVAIVAGHLDAAALAFLALTAVFAGAEAAAHRHDDVIGNDAPLAAATGLALLAVFVVSLVSRQPPLAGGAPVGIVLMVAGVTLRVLAMRALGPRFVTAVAPPDAALVTSGVYRFLRHPSEIGLLAIAVGGALLLASVAGLIACGVAIAPLSWLRVAREDAPLSVAKRECDPLMPRKMA